MSKKMGIVLIKIGLTPLAICVGILKALWAFCEPIYDLWSEYKKY